MDIETLYQLYKRHPIICTDTRIITPGCIFFALVGLNHDGNSFAIEAISKGAAYAVVSDSRISHEQCIIVSDTLQTLQKLAQYYRTTFQIPVLGITGSNGKTTTKELIKSVLQQKFKVHATEGNLNNHIGVPLTLLSMPKDSEFAIIEMGASSIGEIHELCEIAQPNAGLITCIGKAHLEGFGSIEGVLKGKSELYYYIQKTSGVFFLNAEDKYLKQLDANNSNQFSYGFSSENNVVTSLLLGRQDMEICFEYLTTDDQNIQFKTQLYGSYNFINLTAALAVGLYYSVPIEEIQKGIWRYKPDNNRSQILQSGNRILILDAYNANPSSMQEAISAFKLKFLNGVLILGDMKELGDESIVLHQELVDMISQSSWDKVILVGEEFGKADIPSHFIHFKDVDDCKRVISLEDYKNNPILIKGSRSMHLEKLLSENV